MGTQFSQALNSLEFSRHQFRSKYFLLPKISARINIRLWRGDWAAEKEKINVTL